jgi:hypothetical protein
MYEVRRNLQAEFLEIDLAASPTKLSRRCLESQDWIYGLLVAAAGRKHSESRSGIRSKASHASATSTIRWLARSVLQCSKAAALLPLSFRSGVTTSSR